jgi:hypothetical protein
MDDWRKKHVLPSNLPKLLAKLSDPNSDLRKKEPRKMMLEVVEQLESEMRLWPHYHEMELLHSINTVRRVLDAIT